MKPIWPFLFIGVVFVLWLTVWYFGFPSWLSMWAPVTDEYDNRAIDIVFACFIALVSVAALVLFSFGGGGLGYGLASIIGDGVSQKWKQSWKGDMVSMRNADGETGSVVGGLFMIAGSIDQSSVYFYYTKTSDGGFRQQSWKPDGNTTIYEQDRKDGQAVQYKRVFENPKYYWIAEPDDDVAMSFFVPKGSVQKQFKLK